MDQGTVKWFDEKKGFGFIIQANGNDLFVHKSGLKKNVQLTDGMNVEYEVIEGAKGPCATAVHQI